MIRRCPTKQDVSLPNSYQGSVSEELSDQQELEENSCKLSVNLERSFRRLPYVLAADNDASELENVLLKLLSHQHQKRKPLKQN